MGISGLGSDPADVGPADAAAAGAAGECGPDAPAAAPDAGARAASAIERALASGDGGSAAAAAAIAITPLLQDPSSDWPKLKLAANTIPGDTDQFKGMVNQLERDGKLGDLAKACAAATAEMKSDYFGGRPYAGPILGVSGLLGTMQQVMNRYATPAQSQAFFQAGGARNPFAPPLESGADLAGDAAAALSQPFPDKAFRAAASVAGYAGTGLLGPYSEDAKAPDQSCVQRFRDFFDGVAKQAPGGIAGLRNACEQQDRADRAALKLAPTADYHGAVWTMNAYLSLAGTPDEQAAWDSTSKGGS
jgi:hypothetical protein